MLREAIVMAWSEFRPDPASHDHPSIIVVPCPLLHVRSRKLGRWLLCWKWVLVLGTFWSIWLCSVAQLTSAVACVFEFRMELA